MNVTQIFNRLLNHEDLQREETKNLLVSYAENATALF